MKNKIELLILIAVLLTPFVIIPKLDKMEYKLNHPVIYQVDNAGGMTAIGVVTEKKVENGGYSVAVNGYGWFLVTKEHFEMIEVGRKAPQFLLERGS